MFESSYKFNPEFEERHNPFRPHTNLVKKLVRRGILMYSYEFHYNDPPFIMSKVIMLSYIIQSEYMYLHASHKYLKFLQKMVFS